MLRPHILVVFFFIGIAQGQVSPGPVLDARLSVHTLVREDIFAGFMANDRDLLSRGELTLQRLRLERPQDKADIIAWQGWASLTRAMYAHEANNDLECADLYQTARRAYAEAMQLAPNSDAVAIIIGASDALLADRLPNEYRRAAWEEAYIKYREVWKSQGAMFDIFPLHIKGELLSGLAQTAQRTGRDTEAASGLDLIIEKMPGTVYARRAESWKKAPQMASHTAIICQTRHEPRRLAPLTAALPK